MASFERRYDLRRRAAEDLPKAAAIVHDKAEDDDQKSQGDPDRPRDGGALLGDLGDCLRAARAAQRNKRGAGAARPRGAHAQERETRRGVRAGFCAVAVTALVRSQWRWAQFVSCATAARGAHVGGVVGARVGLFLWGAVCLAQFGLMRDLASCRRKARWFGGAPTCQCSI